MSVKSAILMCSEVFIGLSTNTRQKVRNKMAEYHVGCGAFGIYAGRLNKKGDMWVPVSERLPIIGEDVLICDYDGDMYISYLHTDGKWGYDYSGNKLKNIMAWMPLPQPYKAESEVEK